MAKVRIQKEYAYLQVNKEEYYSAFPVQGDLMRWKAIIWGPTQSPYQGGKFELILEFTTNYPYQCPHVYFKTPIYHPNINSRGEICLNILKGEWSPALTIKVILLSVYSLLAEPNMDDPFMPDIAQMYRMNPDLYEKTAITWTQKHAK